MGFGTVLTQFATETKQNEGFRKGSRFRKFGAWRSLVAHLPWAQGVRGSNPRAPTNNKSRIVPAAMLWNARREKARLRPSCLRGASNTCFSPQGTDGLHNAFVVFLVPSKGLEPPHRCRYMDLNHARLPIPPRWQFWTAMQRRPQGRRVRKINVPILQPRQRLSNHTFQAVSK